MYNQLEIYDILFDYYYNFIKQNSLTSIKVAKKSPPTITTFPTIILKEVQNINTDNISLNRQEFVDTISYQVDIYTKDIVENGVEYPSLQLQQELKNLTFDFFLKNGLNTFFHPFWMNLTDYQFRKPMGGNLLDIRKN